MSFSSQQTFEAVSKLKANLSGEVVAQGEEGYDYGIARWSDNCVKQAAYVVFPKTNEDVTHAVRFARDQRLDVAVMGGGHSFSASSSTEGGVVIHLNKYINYARCDPEKRLLYAGGGAIWEAVDKAGMEHGLATVGGTVNHTGVGGLALGGGYGWLTGRYGMTVDNVVQFTVVLASGEIVTANENENPNLFWGCRGGGGNFGVVTEFVFKAYPQRPTVFITRLIFALDKLESLVQAVAEWDATCGPDEALHIACLRGAPGAEPGVPTLMALYFFNGDSAEGRKAAKKLYDVGPVVERPMEDLPFAQANSFQNEFQAHGGRRYIKGVKNRSKISAEAIRAVLQAQDELIKSNPTLNRSGVILECTPKRAVAAVPLEATAYSGRGTAAEMSVFLFYADNAVDGLVQNTVRQWARIAAETAPASSVSDGLCYGNLDPDAATSDASTVFGPNYKRLREVKRKYDPDNIFNKWHPIQPASLA